MPDYVKRMVKEHKDLKAKIQNLHVFLNDEEKTKVLSEPEFNLLHCQVSAMETYDCILASRLSFECSRGNCSLDDVN